MRPQDIVELALAASSADGCVVIVAEHTEANLRWAANSLTTNGVMHSRAVTVVSTFAKATGTSAGVVTRSVTTTAELTALVQASEQAGRDAGPAEDAVPLVDNYAHSDDWSADPGATSVQVFEQFAPALGAMFERWRTADQLLFGFAEHQLTSYFLGTSTGLRRRFDQPAGRVELNGKSADLTRSAWSGLHTRDFAAIDVAGLCAALETRLGWATKRIELPAGRYETILPPTAVADLMIYAYWTGSARDAQEGRNVYAAHNGATRIGERLAALPLTLRSDPDEPGLQCAPFEIATQSDGSLQSVFDNGAPVPATDWIRDGSLVNLARTRAWAAKTNSAPQPVVGNLILDSGDPARKGAGSGGEQLEDMIAGTERGLLLTCLWYIREVDPQTLLLTGLTRDGVFLIEKGAVAAAVNNFRFNESPVDLLGRATEAGRSEPTLSREWSDYFVRTSMPALRIPDFNMSTVSQAK
ncbi:MAG: metallopeptidase TldD-related protein [Actinomycetota bacterium]|nr:metallopeptidase TldD-related protein [Actinomycetota bacterium]